MSAGFAPVLHGEGAIVRPFEDLEDGGLAGSGSLLGSKCTHCNQEMIGRRYACSQCAADAVVAVQLPATGVIYSFSDVHVAAGSEGPVTYAYVDLSNGVRTLAEIRPFGTARIGQAVRFEQSGDDWWFAVDGGE